MKLNKQQQLHQQHTNATAIFNNKNIDLNMHKINNLTSGSSNGISSHQSTGATTATSLSTSQKNHKIQQSQQASFRYSHAAAISQGNLGNQNAYTAQIQTQSQQNSKKTVQTQQQQRNQQNSQQNLNPKNRNVMLSKTGSTQIQNNNHPKLRNIGQNANNHRNITNQSGNSSQSIIMMQAVSNLSGLSSLGGMGYQQNHQSSINENLSSQFLGSSQNLSNQAKQQANAIITPYFSKSMNKLKGIVELQQPLLMNQHNENNMNFQNQLHILPGNQGQYLLSSSRNLSHRNIATQKQTKNIQINKKQSKSSQKQHYINLSNKAKINSNNQGQIQSKVSSPQIDQRQMEQLKQDLLKQYQNFELQHEGISNQRKQNSQYLSPSNKVAQAKMSEFHLNPTLQSMNCGITSSSQQKTNRKQELIQLLESPHSSKFSPEGTAKRQSTQPDHNFCDELQDHNNNGTPRIHRTLDSCLEEDGQYSNGIPKQETLISLHERKTDIKQHIDQQNAINELGSFAFNPANAIRDMQSKAIVIQDVDNILSSNNSNLFNLQSLNYQQKSFNFQNRNTQQPCLDIISPQSPDCSSMLKQNEFAPINLKQVKNQQQIGIRKFDISTLENHTSNICSPLSLKDNQGSHLNSYNTVINNELSQNFVNNEAFNNIKISKESSQNNQKIKNQPFNFISSRNQNKLYQTEDANSKNNFFFSNLIETEAKKFFNMQKQRKISQLNDPQCNEEQEDSNSFNQSSSDENQTNTVTSMYSEVDMQNDNDVFSVPSSGQTSSFKFQKTLDQQIQTLNTQSFQNRSSQIDKLQQSQIENSINIKDNQIQVLEGISGQGFQFQTFSENPNQKIKTGNFDLEYANTISGMPITLIRQNSQARFSNSTNQKMLRTSNKDSQSLNNMKLFDHSKATPAFKKTLKQDMKNQLTSNMTSNTLSSNNWRFSNASDKVHEFQDELQQNNQSEFDTSRHQDSLLETSEHLESNRVIMPQSRQLVKKLPVSLSQVRQVSQIAEKKIEMQKRSNSKVIIMQDQNKKNVYHLIGQAEEPVKHKKPQLRDTRRQTQNQNQRISTQPVNSRQQLIKAKRDHHQNIADKNRGNISDSSQIKSTQPFGQMLYNSTKRMTTNNFSSNKDNSNYGVFGNDMLLQSVMISQNLNKESYLLTQNIYHPSETNPTMIRKESSSCSYCSECEDEEEDDEESHSQLSSSQSIIQPHTTHSNMQSQQAFVQTMFSQNRDGSQPGSNPRTSINQKHQQSMERLSENQINEGVVYQSNGFGQPNPYLAFNQSMQKKKSQGITASMATTSASMLSQKLYEQQRNRISGSLNRMNEKQNLQIQTHSNTISRNPSLHNSNNSQQLNAFMTQSHQNLMFHTNSQPQSTNNMKYNIQFQQQSQPQNRNQTNQNFNQMYQSQQYNQGISSLTHQQQLQNELQKQNQLRKKVEQQIQIKSQNQQMPQSYNLADYNQSMMIDTSLGMKYRPSITYQDNNIVNRQSQNFFRPSLSQIQRTGSSNEIDIKYNPSFLQNSSLYQNGSVQPFNQSQGYQNQNSQSFQQQRTQPQFYNQQQDISKQSSRYPSMENQQCYNMNSQQTLVNHQQINRQNQLGNSQNQNHLQTQVDYNLGNNHRPLMTQSFNQYQFQSFRDQPRINTHQNLNNLVLNQITENNQTESSIDLLPNYIPYQEQRSHQQIIRKSKDSFITTVPPKHSQNPIPRKSYKNAENQDNFSQNINNQALNHQSSNHNMQNSYSQQYNLEFEQRKPSRDQLNRKQSSNRNSRNINKQQIYTQQNEVKHDKQENQHESKAQQVQAQQQNKNCNIF